MDKMTETGTKQNELIQMNETVVTRRPLFDRRKEVFAYELLFKSGLDRHRAMGQAAPGREPTDNTAFKAVDSLLISGLKRLTGGKRAFIHFNRDMFTGDFPFIFPINLLGIEIREDLDASTRQTVITAVEKIKKAGYLIMVPDYLFNKGDIELVKMADIVGVDFRSQGIEKRFALFEGKPVQFHYLARQVETPSDYGVAYDSGYHYFQGEFFCSPENIPVRNISSIKLNLLRILREINKSSVDFEQIEQILKKEVSITYKLLRFINSAAFGFKTTVQSIRHALTLLGEIEARKWLSFIILSAMGADKPQELIRSTIVRAKFCESLADELKAKEETPNYFLMGMFSLVDGFLDRPMQEILADLPLAAPVKEALLGRSNRFREVLDLVTDYERGQWTQFGYAAQALKLAETKIGGLYLDAVEWGKFV